MLSIGKLFRAVPLLALAAFVPLKATAQEAGSQEPGVIVVQYFKCQDPGTFDDIYESVWMERIQDALDAGDFLSAGQLNHYWGDEWNRVLYTTTTDLNTFFSTFSEMFGDVGEDSPGWMKRLEAACSEHKDNIYQVAHALMPSGM